ncbi:CHK kinase-like domain-containing protein [Caenorhabditis elegans]|nr:CHK kinase-like domain-containing protein [Caenorhabditis elegans]NP_503696.2 CHK kinase-like domain-containing protein [Caenorhabditis elegans]CAH2188769.1 CHK kinase-like domain-containing protein [Caenorhabditis elegans]CCD62315.1 CHK kinase-like domain-containing protein [Caenorhabditis elegans]|eukprot:NP_503669.1 Uncharacterized protein CELE_F56A4.5 [Caenorhabditis elegans]
MSLYVAADGILETHVTWQDIEEAMQASLGTKAKFGANKSLRNISDLKGFQSKIALIEPDWVGAEKNQNLPSKFAVKISTQLAFAVFSKITKFDGGNGFGEEKLKFLGKFIREGHNREVEAYKLLEKLNHPDIPHTKAYYLKPFKDKFDLKGFMILDFVPNVHPMPMYESIPADDLISLVRGVATFAGHGESLTAEQRSFARGSDIFELMFEEMYPDEQLERVCGVIQATFGAKNPAVVEECIKLFWIYKNSIKSYSKVSELLGFKLVLNHGDLWQSNMLHCLDEHGNLVLKAIIDWQGVSMLPPGLDLARLLMGCLTAYERRERGAELLMLYHQTFTGIVGEELFSLEELQDSYNLYYPIMTLTLVPMVSSLFENSEMSEVEKTQARLKTEGKLFALLEDLVKVHEQNVKKFPDFLKY